MTHYIVVDSKLARQNDDGTYSTVLYDTHAAPVDLLVEVAELLNESAEEDALELELSDSEASIATHFTPEPAYGVAYGNTFENNDDDTVQGPGGAYTQFRVNYPSPNTWEYYSLAPLGRAGRG